MIRPQLKMLSIQNRMLKWSLAAVWCFVLMTEISAKKKRPGLVSAGPIDARLVDGNSRCSGRLEMKNSGEWRTMNLKYGESRMILWYGEVACRQMGCGSVFSLSHNSNDRVRLAWEVDFSCRGRELTLEDCKHSTRDGQVEGKNASTRSLQVVCSESLRRASVSNPCSGEMEVNSDRGWLPLCEDSFDYKTHHVVCRELGCGQPKAYRKILAHAKSELPTVPALAKEFQCQGNESRLGDCPSSITESCTPVTAISCSHSKNVRLTGGETPCRGTLEGREFAEWRPMVDTWGHMTSEDKDDICGKLGCGSVISVREIYLSQERYAWEIPTDCGSGNPAFCAMWSGRSSYSVLNVTCSETLQLDGPRCSGTLRVKSGQSWVPVCNSFFKPETALVVCRDLACGFLQKFSRMNSDFFADEAVSSRIPVFNCAGGEQLLSECPSTVLNVTEEVLRGCGETHITCGAHAPDTSVRVSSHPDPQYRMAVSKGHRFAVICSVNSLFSVLSFRLVFQPSTQQQIEQIQPSVGGSATFLFPAAEDVHQGPYSCEYNFNFSSEVFHGRKFFTINIRENNYLRLVSEQSRCAGRLELKRDGGWKPLSQRHSWGLREASVACRQLGCGSAALTWTNPSSEVVSTWRFYSSCDGSEKALLDCGAVEEWMSSSTVEVLCSGVLLQPNISFSSMVSEPLGDPQLQQGALLFRGYSFTFTCSVKPQYPGGHFSLIFNQSSSISKPAVNHTAHFRFDAADENHRGNYSCVYYNSVLDLDFSSRSKSFSVGLQDSLDVMLDDGALREDGSRACAGRLMVNRGGGWRMLSADSSVWDLEHASIVCRQLGCGSALSTSEVRLPQNTMMARFHSDCDGSESALLDCGTVLSWFSPTALQVVCTGHSVGSSKK